MPQTLLTTLLLIRARYQDPMAYLLHTSRRQMLIATGIALSQLFRELAPMNVSKSLASYPLWMLSTGKKVNIKLKDLIEGSKSKKKVPEKLKEKLDAFLSSNTMRIVTKTTLFVDIDNQPLLLYLGEDISGAHMGLPVSTSLASIFVLRGVLIGKLAHESDLAHTELLLCMPACGQGWC